MSVICVCVCESVCVDVDIVVECGRGCSGVDFVRMLTSFLPYLFLFKASRLSLALSSRPSRFEYYTDSLIFK